MSSQACEMCLMPFKKDTGNRENKSYCSYCFKNGELSYKEKNIKNFQKLCYDSMVKNGSNKYMAKFYTLFIPFAPHWKRLKKNKIN